MKFPIQNIEANLDEHALLIGERIFDRADFELVKVERNLWITTIEQFEIEIQMASDKVKAYSCECPTFLESGVCGHIAAALFALRKALTEGNKKTANKPKKSNQNLSVNHLLSAIPTEDLQAFIRQYARKNRLFGLALKVRFAAAIPYDNNKEKYNELLDTVFKYIISRQGTISPQGMKHLAGFIEILTNQADDAIALEHFTEAFDLLSVVISRLLHIGKKRGENAEELQGSMSRICEKLQLLAGKDLSPDLKTEIWEFSKKHFSKSTARQLGVAGQLLVIALLLADEKQRREDIIHRVGEQLKLQSPIEHKIELVNKLIPFINKHKDAAKAFTTVLNEQTDYLLLVRASEQLMKGNLPKESLLAARRALEVGPPVDLHQSLRQTMLIAAEQIKDFEEQFENALWLYHETDDPVYFNQCRSIVSKVSDKRIQTIRRQNPFYSEDFLELALYAFREQWPELVQAISRKEDIGVLLKFAGPLYSSRPKEAVHLFESHLDHYLKTHFGPVPARQVAKWLRTIESNGVPELSKILWSYLRKNHPGKLNYEFSDF